MYCFNSKSLWIKVSVHTNAIEVMVNECDKKVLSFAIYWIVTYAIIIYLISVFHSILLRYSWITLFSLSLSQGKLFDSCVKLHVLFLTLVSAMFAVTLCFLLFFHIWLLTSNKTTLGKTCISHIHIYCMRFCRGHNISHHLSVRVAVSPFFCGWTSKWGIWCGCPGKLLTGVWKEQESLAISSIQQVSITQYSLFWLDAWHP